MGGVVVVVSGFMGFICCGSWVGSFRFSSAVFLFVRERLLYVEGFVGRDFLE